MGDVEPCDGAFDAGFEVLGEASAASEPGESPLDDPASGDDDEALGGIAPPDDLDRPIAFAGERISQLVAGITCVGEEVAQPRIEGADGGEHAGRAVAILDVGRMHHDADEVAVRIGDDVALAALDLLPAS